MGRRVIAAVLVLASVLAVAVLMLAPRLAAMLVVSRINLPRSATTTLPFTDIVIDRGDLQLKGWLFTPTTQPVRGLVIHQHGRMYTRIGGIATADVLVPLGFAVLTFDLRAHGDSGGDACTYGVREVADLSAAIDVGLAAVGDVPVVVVGHSLGAVVALQAAAREPRLRAVVAAAAFTDLRTGIAERLPSFVDVDDVAAVIAADAGFDIDDVAPLQTLRQLTIPVLLVHGAHDESTPPAHAQRLYAARASDDVQLLIDPDGEHTTVLNHDAIAWQTIPAFLARAVAR